MNINSPDIYVTSYHKSSSIVLVIRRDKLVFINLPIYIQTEQILVEMYNFQGVNVLQRIMSMEHLRNGMVMSADETGIYFIRIYSKKGVTDEFEGLLFRNDIPIYYHNGKYKFVETVVASNNRIFISQLPQIESRQCSTERLKVFLLAQQITERCNTNYSKILAIHDWVAKNLYYDFDALQFINDPTKCILKPYDIISSKRTICQGFTNITLSLLRTIGIPAIQIVCYALGEDTYGGWENESNRNAESNHVFPATYIDNRWILMDVTWDCNNEYKNGNFIQSKLPVSRKYFDVTERFLSNTHRLISFHL